jgi:tyrosyl-tRNA synthetase
MNVVDEFRWRGMLYDMTEGAEEVLAKEKVVMYTGFDAQGPSLHVGHLIPIMGLVHMQRHGHTSIALLGGGTSMVGDPSGKSKERALLSRENIEANVEQIRQQLSRFLDFEKAGNAARMRNNADWLWPIGMMEFLRDIGKHFTIQQMLAKDSVKQRLEKEEGLSFTEFSYMLLQAFDFLTLFQQEGCTFQMGGSDQWGNITAGTDLVRKVGGGKAHAVVFPLLTTASGEKFGKTANLAGEMDSVWLDANKTSPYKFYQFWFNTDDADVVKYLKLFTLLDESQVSELEQQVKSTPERREAQRRLAEEVTRTVHGEAGLRSAQQASEVLFGGDIAGLTASELMGIFADVPSIEVSREAFGNGGMPLVDLVVEAGFEASKGRARTLIEGGGVSVNNQKVTDKDAAIDLSHSVDGQVLVLRKGKREFRLVKLQR